MKNIQKFCPKGHAYDSSLPACPFCSPVQGGNVGPTAPANNQFGGNIGSTAPANNQFGGNIGSTAPVNNQFGGNVGSTAPVNNQFGGNVGPTAPVNQPQAHQLTQVAPELLTQINSSSQNSFSGNVGSATPVNQPQAHQLTQVAPELLTQVNSSSQQVSTERVRPVVGWLVCVEGPDIGQDFRLHAHFNHVGRAEYQDVCLSDETVSREHFTIAYDLVNNHYFAEMSSNGSTMVYINGYSLGGRVVLKKGDQIKVGNTLLVFIPLEQQDVKWNWRT